LKEKAERFNAYPEIQALSLGLTLMMSMIPYQGTYNLPKRPPQRRTPLIAGLGARGRGLITNVWIIDS